MKPSVILAQEHYKSKVLPRRIPDEIVYNKKGNARPKGFRKAGRDEVGGDFYPVLEVNVKNMAQFGLGISVYLLQLFLIAGLSLVAALIMTPAIMEFLEYEEGTSNDLRLKGTAACAFKYVAVENCVGDFDDCKEEYRESCPISHKAIICDITMCCLFTSLFYFNMFVSRVEDKLDEAVQTAQDYSVVVKDPPADAVDPDEFREFFSRFGRVRNVTITKKNKSLLALLVKKRTILRKIHPRHSAELQDKIVISPQHASAAGKCTKVLQKMGFFRDESFWIAQLCDVNIRIAEACKLSYDACRVFVSFEAEQEQRLCLRELDVSEYNAITDTGVNEMRKKFRGKDILEVVESAEPNNILWLNLEMGWVERKLRFITGWILSFATFAACYFIIEATFVGAPTWVPVVIGGIDSCLPVIFIAITKFEHHIDEDDRQNSLLFKLYGGKLLSSVVFVFIKTEPVMMLDNQEIIKIINIQLSASFISPFVKAMDFYGVFMRWVAAPLLATNQAEMNQYYEGSQFILADRYTELSKIIFISLFYSFIIPTSLYISTIACLVLFLADKYVLVRKTKQPPMLDSTMAKTVRTYTLFALAVHMYITCRFIYSWPFDEVQRLSTGVFKKVNKRAPLFLLDMKTQPWHSNSQEALLRTYKIAAAVIICCVFFIVVVEPICKALKEFFVKESEEETARCSDKLYTSIHGMVAYCPVIPHSTETFIAADTSEMLARHKPDTVSVFPMEHPNIGSLLSPDVRPYVLAKVKWYPPDTEIGEESALNIDPNDPNLVRDVLFDALKESMGLGKSPEELRAEPEKVFRKPLRNDLCARAAEQSSNMDLVHIQMTDPRWGYETSDRNPDSEEYKELRPARGDEPSRIRKSVAAIRASKRSNKVALDPGPSVGSIPDKDGKTYREVSPTEVKGVSAFTREELYLMRQMRRDVLDKDPNEDIWRPGERENGAPANYLTFEEFTMAIHKVAPSSLDRSAKLSVNATRADMNAARRYNKTLMRRIYVKFLTMQSTIAAGNEHSEILHWPSFMSFIQTGGAAAISNLEKK